MLRSRIEDSAVVGKEVSARRAALPARDAMQTRAVDVHDELLIASGVRCCTLEDELASRPREIRFGVLTAEGELPDIAQVHLAGIGGGGLEGSGRAAGREREESSVGAG